MYLRLHVKYPSFLSDSKQTLNNIDKFSKNTKFSNFMKIRVVRTKFHADGRTDVTKLQLVFALF